MREANWAVWNTPASCLSLTSECSVLDGDTLSTGASFSSLLAAECLRGGTGLIVWVIANEMGRSLSWILSCVDRHDD